MDTVKHLEYLEFELSKRIGEHQEILFILD